MFPFRCCCLKWNKRKNSDRISGDTADSTVNSTSERNDSKTYTASIIRRSEKHRTRRQTQSTRRLLRRRERQTPEASLTTLLASERIVLVYPRIVIVGGGIAGIACAVDLVKKGYNVHILEAQNRLGGRVCTLPFADNVADLGAQWCHGEGGNAVYKMVKHLSLVESSGDMYINFECIRSNGQIVPNTIVRQLKDILADIFIADRGEMTRYDGSLANFLYEKFYAAVDRNSSLRDVERHIITEFFENFKRVETSDCGPTLDEVSARGFAEYFECEGDYTLNWKTHGFGELINVMTKAKKLKKKLGVLESKVHFNTKVEKIYWSCDDAVVRVKCEGKDELLEVDSVVVTVSLGVLKCCAKNMFEPALPSDKLKAIEAIGFGDVCKIFLEFEKAFWPPEWNGFSALWRDEDLMDVLNEKNSWITEIYGFYRVPYQPRVLLAWMVGSTVKHMETLNTNYIQNELVRLLHRFLPTWNITEPKKILVSSWSTDDNFRGAYSFRTLKTEAANTGASVLAQPLTLLAAAPSVASRANSESESVTPSNANAHDIRKMASYISHYTARYTLKPVLLFAGEATSPHQFSTVHGALESGRREAKRLIGYYENEDVAYTP